MKQSSKRFLAQKLEKTHWYLTKSGTHLNNLCKMTIPLVKWSLHAKSPFNIYACNLNGSLNTYVDVSAFGMNLVTRQRGRPQTLPKLPPLLLGGPSGWRSSRPPSPAGIQRTSGCKRCAMPYWNLGESCCWWPRSPRAGPKLLKGAAGKRVKYGQVVNIRNRMRADTASCGLDSHHTINHAGTGLTNKSPLQLPPTSRPTQACKQALIGVTAGGYT